MDERRVLTTRGLDKLQDDRAVKQRTKLDNHLAYEESRVKHAHNDYTLGWICALPLELAAARSMLNWEHRVPDHPLAEQNCVYAGTDDWPQRCHCLLTSALCRMNAVVSVATTLTRTFASARILLTVGIGGGVSGQHGGVRLEDVVVSEPNDRLKGLVHVENGVLGQDAVKPRPASE